jgi:tetratricopeptide (TPR) repeat protein
MNKVFLFLSLLLLTTVMLHAQVAEKAFPAVVETNNPDTESLIAKAIGHYDGGRYQQAKELINEAMQINQEGRLSDILFYYRALCSIQLEEDQAAHSDLDTAISFNNQKPHYFYHRANLKLKATAIDEAFADYEKALSLEPRYEAAWMKKGLILQQKNRIREALIAYNKAIELNDKNAKAYYYRAMIMLQVGMPDKGCADLEKAADLGYRAAEKAQNQYCSQ